jgi:hypothetical protein
MASKDAQVRQREEVELCVIKDCSLYPYRFGHRPGAEKREATPEQKERLKKAREKARTTRS